MNQRPQELHLAGLRNLPPALTPTFNLRSLPLRIALGMQPPEPILPALTRAARHTLPTLQLDATLTTDPHRLLTTLRVIASKRPSAIAPLADRLPTIRPRPIDRKILQ